MESHDDGPPGQVGLLSTRMATRSASLRVDGIYTEVMTRAITVRLDEADHAALEQQADELRVRPGTLARMLLHAGLREGGPARGGADARAALDRLVQRSRLQPSVDAVALVAEARVALEPDR